MIDPSNDIGMKAGDHSNIIEVAVPVPLRRTFAYRVPDEHKTSSLKLGMRVLVPFGRRKLTGWITGVNIAPPPSGIALKYIDRILDTVPLIPPDILELVHWCITYYHHPPGEVFSTAVPAVMRRRESAPIPKKTRLMATDSGQQTNLESLHRAPKQRDLLIALRGSPNGLTKSAVSQSYSSGVLVALINRDLARWTEGPETITPFDPTLLSVQDQGIVPSTEQANAIEAASKPGTHLLFGVTGSGKTEIYLKLIEQVLQQGRQALILVPEIGLTPQTIERFQQRFSIPVMTMHSGMTDNERYANWQKARNGNAGIIIGTRSSIFVPLHKPGILIVDEEHDSSYKQNDGLRYSARDLAVLRGQREGIPVILGSATPSSESFHNAMTERYHLHRLTTRPGNVQLPTQQIVNLAHYPADGGLAAPTLTAMHDHLGAGNQVLVFQNRRGYSPVLMCLTCNWRAQCTACDAPLTLHRGEHRLRCHHCGHQMPVPPRCPSCGQQHLIPLGLGTERIEQHLTSKFGDIPILRVDRDTTRQKHAFETLRTQISDGNPAILVGTQLLAKGHHFPRVTLVVIIDLDAGFYSADFKATERTAQLLTQVGGRAGREDRPGTVIIQTHFPNEAMFSTLINQDYEQFLTDLLSERETFALPPHRFIATARAESRKPDTALRFLTNASKGINVPGVEVLGPLPANMEKREGYYRAQLLFTAGRRAQLHKGLSRFLIKTASLSRSGLRLSLDVDPTDSL